MKVKRFSISIDEETYKEIERISNSTEESIAEVTRDLIKKGLKGNWMEDNRNDIASIVRSSMELVIKPHVERLAKISAKGGHMSATATFLNVQALIDLVPKERGKDVIKMYESARVKSVSYMKIPTDEFNLEEIVSSNNKEDK